MKALPLVLALGLLAGCASSTPFWDAHFGDAVRQSRYAMALNPVPATAAGGVEVGGLEGKTAQQAAARYHQSFESPPPVVNVINIGNSVSGGGR